MSYDVFDSPMMNINGFSLHFSHVKGTVAELLVITFLQSSGHHHNKYLDSLHIKISKFKVYDPNLINYLNALKQSTCKTCQACPAVPIRKNVCTITSVGYKVKLMVKQC